jgi:hypothetical protein
MLRAMPVSLPERTVDAWVTAYVTKRVPDALLWAPTQNQIPDYDIATSLPEPGKLFVLEDKAPYANGTHHFDLPVRQIWNYLRDPFLRSRTFYVLPCPPFSATVVPGGRGAAKSHTRKLLPRRAQSRLAGHPWPPSRSQPSQPCEEWFRVIPVIDLWNRSVLGEPPAIGVPRWPTRKGGPAPTGAPARLTLRLTCPLSTALGESLRVFMDRLLECDRPDLRFDPEWSDDIPRIIDDGHVSPLYQAIVAFAPASNLPGWD